MDYEGFLQRLNLQSITKHLLYGDSAIEADMEEGTLRERLEKFEAAYTAAMQDFDDELGEKIFCNVGLSEDAHFELGLMSGLLFYKVLLDIPQAK